MNLDGIFAVLPNVCWTSLGCLLGANSGLGISLGDDCVIEAGLYLTAGTIVTLPGGRQAKARDLSGQPGLRVRARYPGNDGGSEREPDRASGGTMRERATRETRS
jgi:hypothetical protein